MRWLWLIAVSVTVAHSELSGRSSSEFLARARDAIGGADALARIHSLHIAGFGNVQRNDGRIPSGGGDWLGKGNGGGAPRALTHIWLSPPSRFLQTSGAFRGGFDGDRIIGSVPSETSGHRSALWRWALPLLLWDPRTLGLSLTNEWDETLAKKAVHVLEVTGPDDFDERLYFDSRSARLVMAQVAVRAFRYSGLTGMPAGSLVVSEQDDYSEYRRVAGIELPFRIRREVQTGRNLFTTEVDIVEYDLNPKNLDRQFK